MKARAGRTTFDNLPKELQTTLKGIANQLAEERWMEVQGIASERFLYALALALNDRLGYREKGIMMVLGAVNEILVGYSEDCYTPKESRVGTTDLERIANAMKAELADRGIDLTWD